MVLEEPKKQARYGWAEAWFGNAFAGLSFLVRPMYVSKEVLIRLSRALGNDVYFTRESNADILRNAPVTVQSLSAALYVILLSISLVVGVLYGFVTGAIMLLVAFAVPVLGLRMYNTYFNHGGGNRDEVIAEKIVEAASENDSVLAVVGDAHADGVRRAIPEEIEVKYYQPRYGRFSVTHLREMLLPFALVLLRTVGLYVVVLWLFFRLAPLLT